MGILDFYHRFTTFNYRVMKSRINDFIQFTGLPIANFEQRCGLSNGAVSKMGDNTRMSTIDKISKAFPELNIVWLRTGEGKMLNPTPSTTPTMDKRRMLEELIDHYAEGNKAKFARMLEVSPQTVSTWISRESFDAELIYTKCEGISGDWLLSGEGPMLKKDMPTTCQPSHIEELVFKLFDEVHKKRKV